MSFHRLLLIGILLLAFALRVVALDQIPPGLSHDEAYNGVTAIQVLHGQHLIFFEINKGIEPLIIYLEALAFYAFGIGPVPMRLINVMCGMLTVVLVYPLTRRLFNRRVALLAMAGLAVSFWAIFTSRLALRAVTLPPLLILTFYFLWRGLEIRGQGSGDRGRGTGVRKQQFLSHPPSSIFHFPSSILFFALSGLAAGATMYTYLSSRFVPLLIAALFGYHLLWRRVTKQHWLGIVILFLLWVVIFAPLANYFWEHRASFSERSNQVSTLPYALNGDFAPVLRHTLRTLGMFTFHGDETDRYNLDGRPVFDWFNGLLFYVGVAIALWRLRRPVSSAAPAAWLLLSLFFMLLPGFITDDSPHFLRTIGALPIVYILWAVGLEAASQRMADKRISRLSAQPPFRTFHVSFFILILFLHTSYDYFIRWANAPEARYIYGADMAEVAHYVNATRDDGLAAISAEYYRDLDPFRFTLHSQGQSPFVIWFDGRQSLALPPAGSGLSPRYIFPLSAPPAEAWQPFLQSVPAESGREYTLYHLAEAAALTQAQAATFPSQNKLGVKVNDDLILTAYQVLGSVVSGGKFQILLGWQALQAVPPDSDYTFLVQLQDSQENVWAEADGNGYPPANWQPGVQGLQLLTLRLPGDLPPRLYHLTAQIVDRHSGQALPTATGESIIALTSLFGQLAQTPRVIEPDTLPNPMQVVQITASAPQIALRGYKIKTITLHPAESLSLSLYWQVLQPPSQDYRLEFFLANESEEIVYRWPALAPINGEWPTSQWPAHYWVQDRLNLPVGPNVPPGQFAFRAAWVAENSEEAAHQGESWAGFDLGKVIITP